MDIVKEIMIKKDTSNYVLRSKSGWGFQDNTDIGWYIGYLSIKEKVCYFVNCIQTNDVNNENFANARIDIVNSILEDLKLTEK